MYYLSLFGKDKTFYSGDSTGLPPSFLVTPTLGSYIILSTTIFVGLLYYNVRRVISIDFLNTLSEIERFFPIFMKIIRGRFWQPNRCSMNILLPFCFVYRFLDGYCTDSTQLYWKGLSDNAPFIHDNPCVETAGCDFWSGTFRFQNEREWRLCYICFYKSIFKAFYASLKCLS